MIRFKHLIIGNVCSKSTGTCIPPRPPEKPCLRLYSLCLVPFLPRDESGLKGWGPSPSDAEGPENRAYSCAPVSCYGYLSIMFYSSSLDYF